MHVCVDLIFPPPDALAAQRKKRSRVFVGGLDNVVPGGGISGTSNEGQVDTTDILALYERRYGMLKIGLNIFIVALSMFLFPLFVFLVRSDAQQLWQTRCNLQELGQNSTYYDEVLTMSTYAAVYSGQTRWIDRYDKEVVFLDEVISKTLEGAPEVAAAFFAKTDIANQELIAMEIQMHNLTRFGELQKAQAIMESATYQEWKSLYLRGVVELKNQLKKDTVEVDKAHERAIIMWAVITSLLYLFTLSTLLKLMYYGERRTESIRELAKVEKMFDLEHVLNDNTANQLFLKFSRKLRCDEMNRFWNRSTDAMAGMAAVLDRAGASHIKHQKYLLLELSKLWNRFGQIGAQDELNISASQRDQWEKAQAEIDGFLQSKVFEKSDDDADKKRIFVEIKESIESYYSVMDQVRFSILGLMKSNLYLPFVRSVEFTSFLRDRFSQAGSTGSTPLGGIAKQRHGGAANFIDSSTSKDRENPRVGEHENFDASGTPYEP